MSRGTAHQIDYWIVASARREQETSRGNYGPWLTVLQEEIRADDGHFASPAKSILITGREQLLALRSAIDDALSKEAP